MLPSVVAWLLAIVFGTAGLEKALRPSARQRLVQAVREWVPAGGTGLAAAYLLAELLAIPLLAWRPGIGLAWLVGLTAVVTAYAAHQWWTGREADCPCGGLWAATGRNLLLRNALLLAAALYAWWAAPRPLAPRSAGLAVLTLLVGLVAGAAVEAVRVYRYSR